MNTISGTQKKVLLTQDGGLPVLLVEQTPDGKYYLTAGDGNFNGEMSPYKRKIWEEKIYKPISLCLDGTITEYECILALASVMDLPVKDTLSILSEYKVFTAGKLSLKNYIYGKDPICAVIGGKNQTGVYSFESQ
jgi:hypothetical protein